MVREIGVHDDDEVAGCRFEAVNISGAEAEFTGPRAQEDVFGVVQLLHLFGDFEGAVRGGIVDDDDFVVEVVFGESVVEKPDYNGEVTALVVLDDWVNSVGTTHEGEGAHCW